MTDHETVIRDCALRLAHDEEQAAARRAERDDAIRAAVADGVTMYRIAKWVGISQQAVRLIVMKEER